MNETDQTVWVVIGNSESGDDYAAVFANNPTKKQLTELAFMWDGTDEADGPGYAGSYVYVTVGAYPIYE